MGEARPACPREALRGARAKAAAVQRKQALPVRRGQLLVAPEREGLRLRHAPRCRQRLAAPAWRRAQLGWALQRLIAAGAMIDDRSVALPRPAPREHGPLLSQPRSVLMLTPCRLRAPQRPRRRQANALIRRWRAGTTTARFAGVVPARAVSIIPFANRSILLSGLASSRTPRVRTPCRRRVLRAMPPPS